MTLIFNDTTDLPREIYPILYRTKNGKWGVCSNRLFDEWFVDKYSVIEWAYLPDKDDFNR